MFSIFRIYLYMFIRAYNPTFLQPFTVCTSGWITLEYGAWRISMCGTATSRMRLVWKHELIFPLPSNPPKSHWKRTITLSTALWWNTSISMARVPACESWAWITENCTMLFHLLSGNLFMVLRWCDSYYVMTSVYFRISVDEMDVSVEGTATVKLVPPGLVFDSALLDLEMWRWTVSDFWGCDVYWENLLLNLFIISLSVPLHVYIYRSHGEWKKLAIIAIQNEM